MLEGRPSPMALAALTSVLLLSLCATARATVVNYHYSYEQESGSVIAGMLSGVLQADLDTVMVLDITMPTYNRNAAPVVASIQSVTAVFNETAGPAPVVSISGVLMDIITCSDPAGGLCNTDPNNSEGFLFDTAGLYGASHQSSPFYDFVLESFDPDRWSLVAKVSEPSALALVLLGGLLLHRARSPRLRMTTQAVVSGGL